MLCLDMRLVQRLRGERTETASTSSTTKTTAAAASTARDRSKSVCVTSFRNKPLRDVSALKLLHRRASSAM